MSKRSFQTKRNVKKTGTGPNTVKTNPEGVLKEFFLSQSNAENAISLWMDSMGAINMERGDYAIIEGWDKLRSSLYIRVQNRR